MDLLALFSTLRRHKLIVALVFLAVLGGQAFLVFGTSPQYESKAQYVLALPPSLPTDLQIQRDPSLARLNTDNPYLRVPSPSVVADVLAQRVSGESVRRSLRDQGADEDYVVAPALGFGSGLLIDITGTGTSPALATRTVDLVSKRLAAELHDMQTVNGADERYLIKVLPVSPATMPIRKVTGTIRSIIAVTVAGIVLLFAAISVAEALSTWRPERRRRKASHGVPTNRGEPPAAMDTVPIRRPATTDEQASDTDATMLLPHRRDWR